MSGGHKFYRTSVNLGRDYVWHSTSSSLTQHKQSSTIRVLRVAHQHHP
jgi:hypothetical protein